MTIADRTAGLSGEQQIPPITGGFAITPADADLTRRTRALWVGTSGNLTLKLAGGETVVLKNVAAGTLLPVRADQVKAATTAADIVGLD